MHVHRTQKIQGLSNLSSKSELVSRMLHETLCPRNCTHARNPTQEGQSFSQDTTSREDLRGYTLTHSSWDIEERTFSDLKDAEMNGLHVQYHTRTFPFDS